MKQVSERGEGVELVYLDECRETNIYVYDDSSDFFILKELECDIGFEYAWVPINDVSTSHSGSFESIQEAILPILKNGEFIYEFEDTKEFISWAKKIIDKEED